MKSQRWITTLIGLAMLGIIGALVIVGGVFFWRNSNLRALAVDGPVAEVTVTNEAITSTDEASATEETTVTAPVGGDSEESTPTNTLPPTVTPLPTASDTAVPTDTPVPTMPTNTAVPPTNTLTSSGEDFTSYDDNQAMLNLVNQERCAQGLTPVTYNGQLYNAALQHSVDMLKNDFFDHAGSDGSTIKERASAQGYPWLAIGENIAAGQVDANEAFADWMGSPGHRDNILKPEYREMAVAHIFRDVSTYGHYWTQVFGNTGSDPISCAEAGF